MLDLNELRDDHDLLMAVAGHLSELIASDEQPPPAKLYEVRMALASKLLRHLMNEDWALYPQLLASKDARIAATARAFTTELGGLADAYREHTHRWSAAAIAQDWQGYRREAGELLDGLRRRVTRENEELYPLLEAAGRRAA